MSLIVNGGRLEPPVGVPDQIYSIMLACWSTVDNDRPRFDDIIESLDSMLQDPVMQSMPLPTIVHRLSQTQPASSNPPLPDSPSSVAESISQNAYSQSTINTMLNSFSEAATPSDCVPLPTTGDGVNFSVCTPYQPQGLEPFCAVEDSQIAAHSLWAAEQIASTHSDAEEPVDNCRNQAFSSRTLQDAAAGSRRPVVDTVSIAYFFFFF
ncbi:unnamed protein product [Gongylonema pulchrum]|uniref:Pkinase_Tyr domain-containing protein n=1 Tax=Gongylonema pulchrum TaxID=637853 RepID=A0A183ETN7_9BILA|nr:unnamed protein product [Gongylonema pulchrum]